MTRPDLLVWPEFRLACLAGGGFDAESSALRLFGRFLGVAAGVTGNGSSEKSSSALLCRQFFVPTMPWKNKLVEDSSGQ